MAGERVKMIMEPGSDGEYQVKWELEGFEGESCKALEEIEARIGQVQDRKETDEAYQGRQELPIPNQVSE